MMCSKRRKTFAAALAAVPLALLSRAASAAATSDTCVKNGNFETCDFTGWVVSSGTASPQNEEALIDDDAIAPYLNRQNEDGWGECSANMGGNSIPHDGQTVKVRRLSQEIDFGPCLPPFAVGDDDFVATLSLEFKYRNLAGPHPRGRQSVSVSLNGRDVMSFDETEFPNKPDGRPLLFTVEKKTFDVTKQLKAIVSNGAKAVLTLEEKDVNEDVLITWDNIRIDFADASSSTTTSSSPATTPPATTPLTMTTQSARLRTKTKVRSSAVTTATSTSTPSTTTGSQTRDSDSDRMIDDRISKNKTKTKVKRHGSTMLRH